MTKKRLLVLGGSSFLGGHLLQAADQELDIVATYLTSLPHLGSIKFRRCNLLSRADLFSLGQFDVVVLFASIVAGNSKLHHNLVMVENTVEFCNRMGAHLIYISSSQVHFKQNSTYKTSKIQSEQVVTNNCVKFNIVRPAAPYGPRLAFQPTRSQPFHVLTDLIQKLPVVPIIGTGRYLRQPLHVRDLNQLILAIIRSPVLNQVYEIGGPEKYEFRKVVEIISGSLGKRVTGIYLPTFLFAIAANFVRFIDPELVKAATSSEGVDNDTWKRHYEIDLTTFEEGVEDLIGGL